MEENDREILNFWSELEFDVFDLWNPPTPALPTTTMTYATGSATVPSSVESTTSLTGNITGTGSLGRYQTFCMSQQLTFCTNCEPMCIIHQNCILYNICEDNTPFNQNYWTPLIEACCSICNIECQILPALSIMAAPTTAPVDQFPINALSTHFPISTTSSPSLSVSPSTMPTTMPRDNLLIYILVPIFSIILLGLTIFGACYQKKHKCISLKYLTSNSKNETVNENPSTLSVQNDDEDITDLTVTELWNRIKSDNNYDSKHSKPGTFNRAPLALVLESDTSAL